MSASKSLLDLPDELLVIIVKRLEVIDQLHVNDVCQRLRNVVNERNVVSACRLSCSPLATAETLCHPFFRNLSSRITELDLKLIKDLTKTKLLPALKKIDNLVSLDVSYTNVAFDEFHLICEVCPKLVKICIGVKLPDREVQPKIIEHLAKMEYIHFVNYGSCVNLMILLPFMNGPFSKLKELKYTGAAERFSVDALFTEDSENDVKISGLDSCFKYQLTHNYRDIFDVDDWEYIFISNDFPDSKVFMSPKLYNNYQLSDLYEYWDVENTGYDQNIFQKNGNVFLWQLNFANTNKHFYRNVLREIENKLVNIVCFRKLYNKVSIPYRSNFSSSSYYFSLCSLQEKSVDQKSFAKRQTTCEHIKLNIDKHVVDPSKDIKLMIGTECCCRIPRVRCCCRIPRIQCCSFTGTLLYDPTSVTMKNLTFLHLRDIVSVEANFFKLLFEQCKMLATLNIDNKDAMVPNYYLSSLNLVSSLKNLRIKEPGVLGTRMLESLSKCTNLENVHICDFLPKTEKIPDERMLALFAKNPRLYAYCLYAKFSDFKTQGKKQLMSLKKEMAKKNDRALCFIDFVDVKTVCQYTLKMNSDGFSDVFFLDNVYRSIAVNMQG